MFCLQENRGCVEKSEDQTAWQKQNRKQLGSDVGMTMAAGLRDLQGHLTSTHV